MARRKATSADDALKLIGDDPQTLVLAIQLMERMAAKRRKAKRARAA